MEAYIYKHAASQSVWRIMTTLLAIELIIAAILMWGPVDSKVEPVESNQVEAGR